MASKEVSDILSRLRQQRHQQRFRLAGIVNKKTGRGVGKHEAEMEARRRGVPERIFDRRHAAASGHYWDED